MNRSNVSPHLSGRAIQSIALLFLFITGCWDGGTRDRILSGKEAQKSLDALYASHWNYHLFDYVSTKSVTAYQRESFDSAQWWFEVSLDRTTVEELEAMICGATKSMIDNDQAVLTVGEFDPANALDMDTPPEGWAFRTIVGPAKQVELRVRATTNRELFVQTTTFVFSPDDRRVFIARRQL